MKKFWTVLPLCAAMLCTSAFAAAFPDLPEEHWAYSAVDKMHSDGRVNGFPDGEFKPDELVTRWQFAKMAGRRPGRHALPGSAGNPCRGGGISLGEEPENRQRLHRLR